MFLISAGMLIVSGILYVLLASSELQSWNSPDVKLKQEIISLNEKNTGESLKQSNFDEEAYAGERRLDSEDDLDLPPKNESKVVSSCILESLIFQT